MDATTVAPQDNELHPALEAAVSSFQDDGAQKWAGDIATDIQQHLNLVNTADANTAAGEQFVNNLADVKTNLVNMVKADPTSADLALGMAPKLVGPLLANSNVDADKIADTHDSIVDHMQQQISHAAIIRMADFSSDNAKALISKYSDYLGEGNDATLSRYADAMQAARNVDRQAGVQQGQDRAAAASSLSAFQQGSRLLDPHSEDTVFPENFAADLMRNQSINPQDKVPLYNAFNALRTVGDAPASDPHLVTAILNNIAQGQDVGHDDILQHVGGGLKYADAWMLHGLTQTQSPVASGATQQLASVMNAAQQRLAGSGDRAGDAAFSRFADWFLPSYRRAGPDGLNSSSPSFINPHGNMALFALQHDDIVPTTDPGSRRSLGEIFGQV